MAGYFFPLCSLQIRRGRARFRATRAANRPGGMAMTHVARYACGCVVPVVASSLPEAHQNAPARCEAHQDALTAVLTLRRGGTHTLDADDHYSRFGELAARRFPEGRA